MTCEHCGRELPTRKAYGIAFPVPCDCEGAVRERERLDEEERRTNRESAYARALERAGIPEALSLYPEWGDGSSLYLYGEQGRGKTEMACGALRKYIREGVRPYESRSKAYYASHSGRYVLVPEWLMRVRSTYGSRRASEEDLVEALAGVGMLVLDDLGKGRMTEWAVERIYMILDIRYRDGRKTVITSNYSPEEVMRLCAEATDQTMGAAIRSRIEGMCRPVRVGGPDYRVMNRN